MKIDDAMLKIFSWLCYYGATSQQLSQTLEVFHWDGNLFRKKMKWKLRESFLLAQRAIDQAVKLETS